MKQPTLEPLTYGPAYLGLYTCLLLAVACNAFLDIRYGSFGRETLFWGVVFAVTLGVGWRQRGVPDSRGKSWQRTLLVLTVIAFLLFFLPVWGMPRAGAYLLCGMQAAQNCITTSRRHFQFAILTSLALVLFAAAHARADWTLLFYLLPYVVAVVTTLVAEQVARRSRQVAQHSLGGHAARGQGLAVAAASAVILLLASLIYTVTPQETWLSFSWRHGLPAGASLGRGEPIGQSGGNGSDGADNGASGGGTGNGIGNGLGGAESGPLRSDWPTPEEMRQAAKRPGMPAWQGEIMNAMADGAETLERWLAPARDVLADLWAALKKWLEAHKKAVALTLLGLLLLGLLLAWLFLSRESRPLLWLHTRLDYLMQTHWHQHGSDRRAARLLYAAFERLFLLHELGRHPAQTAREYQWQLGARHPELRGDLHRLTWLFEQARYSAAPTTAKGLAAMRESYRRLYLALADA